MCGIKFNLLADKGQLKVIAFLNTIQMYKFKELVPSLSEASLHNVKKN
jgi:hypothetical protein